MGRDTIGKQAARDGVREQIGVAAADLSTGELRLFVVTVADAPAVLARLAPREMLLVRREAAGLRKLAGVPGTPQGAFRIDAFALAYRFVPGRGLRRFPVETLSPGFFPSLERSVTELHARARIVHLDLRNADNILVTEAGEPMLLDFQSHIGLRWMPAPLRRFAERVDRAAIYKHWARRLPATLGPERSAVLARINELRPLWALRGYIGSPRRRRRKR
jgi:hypothetical protein